MEKKSYFGQRYVLMLNYKSYYIMIGLLICRFLCRKPGFENPMEEPVCRARDR